MIETSHKLQLIWGDVLKKRPFILKTIMTYFSAMKSMNVGKSSTHFFERAAELKNCVLTNKTFQATRFVRSLLRGITSALRNLPTLIAVIAEDYTEAALNHENTKAKELLEVLKNLRNAETLFFTTYWFKSNFGNLLWCFIGSSACLPFPYSGLVKN